MVVTGKVSKVRLPGRNSYWLDVDGYDYSFSFSYPYFPSNELERIEKLVDKVITVEVSINNRKVLKLIN